VFPTEKSAFTSSPEFPDQDDPGHGNSRKITNARVDRLTVGDPKIARGAADGIFIQENFRATEGIDES
jgi:hypothetical protein